MAYGMQPINVTAATLTLDKDTHGFTTVTVNRAAGCAITLPTANGDGTVFDIYVGTTISSNSLSIAAPDANTIIQGTLAVCTDIGGTVAPTSTTSDTITMSGSTTGGIVGSRVFLKDVAVGVWAVSGGLVASGTEATPFSAAVP